MATPVRLRPAAIAVRCAEALLAGGVAAAVSAATFALMSWAQAPAQAAPPSQVRWAVAVARPPADARPRPLTHALTALTSAYSPLTAASRHYELGLMRSVEPGENWGVTAAADPGSRPAVKNGWLPDGSQPGLWVINSIGVLRHHGQRLLVAVLSSAQPTEAVGISQVQAAARAAAAAVTQPACPS